MPSAAQQLSDLLGGLGGGGAPTSSATTSDPLVYVGTPPKRVKMTDRGPRPEPFAEPNYQTSSQLLAQMYQWDPARLAQFQHQAVAAGLLNKATGVWDHSTERAWAALIDTAAKLTAVGKNITPDELLAMHVSEAQKMGGLAGTKDYTSTDTSTIANLTDPETAKFYLNKVFEQRLGRRVTNAEAQAFAASLNSAEAASPKTRQTSRQSAVTTDSTGAARTTSTSSSATESGGFNPAQYAEDYVSSGDLGTQANTRTIGVDYWRAAMQTLAALK